MDINAKFRKILIENKIISEASSDRAVETLKKLQAERKRGIRIGLYGVGIEAEGLMRFISENVDEFVIDACFDKTIRNYEHKSMILDSQVYTIENIGGMNIDYVILGSHRYKDNFVKNIMEVGYKGKIVDLYADMQEYMQNAYADYQTVYEARQAYLNSDVADKPKQLRTLIKEYLLLKDFKNAFCYINEYTEKKYANREQYQKLREDLNSFLDEIEDCITKRNRKDIIINWVDALSFYDIPRFPFLHSKGQEGISFKNAYTVMPWTTETTKTILSGNYPIEGQLFLQNDFSAENMQLLKILEENGYGFGYCGMPKLAKRFEDAVITSVCYFENKYSASMQKQWDALSILCENDRPMCILIHTLRETHEPFICANGDTCLWFGSTVHDWEQEDCRKQAAISGMYIDEQLEFYERFYHENAIKIYMSDHGRVGNSPMNDNKIHVMLTVCGKNIESKSEENLFSLVQFPWLVKKIISGEKNLNTITSEYVLIENYDAYDELPVRDTLSGRLKREEMYQCRGIVTKADSYYKYVFGKEYYFRKEKPNENQIDKEEYCNRINELKNLCGNEFIDIFKYDKFKYSRLLYK